jgi:hypothetical protein
MCWKHSTIAARTAHLRQLRGITLSRSPRAGGRLPAILFPPAPPATAAKRTSQLINGCRMRLDQYIRGSKIGGRCLRPASTDKVLFVHSIDVVLMLSLLPGRRGSRGGQPAARRAGLIPFPRDSSCFGALRASAVPASPTSCTGSRRTGTGAGGGSHSASC